MKPFRASMPLIAIVVATALALSGCGSSSDETGNGATAPAGAESTGAPSSGAPSGIRVQACEATGSDLEVVRVTELTCAEGRKVASAWADAENCTIPEQASRGSCRVQGRICLSTVADRGVSVTCAAPGQSVAFIVRRR